MHSSSTIWRSDFYLTASPQAEGSYSFEDASSEIEACAGYKAKGNVSQAIRDLNSHFLRSESCYPYNPLMVVLGAGGVGKSAAPNLFARIFGSHHKQTSKPRYYSEPWLVEIDMNQTTKLMLSFNSFQNLHIENLLPYHRLDWPLHQMQPQPTDIDLSPTFNKLSESTTQFIKDSNLTDEVLWLQDVAPKHFEGCDFELTVLRGEDSDDTLLGLKVYGAFSVMDFRERRHSLCSEMVKAGHTSLRGIISIFQRRIDSHGWETFSWYSSISNK